MLSKFYLKFNLVNYDNIQQTNRYNYIKIYTGFVQSNTCQICGKIKDEFKPDSKDELWVHKQQHFPICFKCYDNLPCPSVCRTCSAIFPSRNKLFNHLHTSGHHLDPLIDKKYGIEFACLFDYSLFHGTSKVDTTRFFVFDYKNIFNSNCFLTVGNNKTKVVFKTVRKEIILEEIKNVVINTRDNISEIIFNGDEFIFYVYNDIGWILWNNLYYIPIIRFYFEI